MRRVELETGKVLQKRDVSPQYFGEGITVFKSDLIELTWQTHVAFVYDRASFEPKKQFSYPGEGWGLTHDGTSLIMSDGTDELRYLDPVTFAEKRRLKVTAAGSPLRNLNELEYVKNEIFANIWQTDEIVRISPRTGNILGRIDLSSLIDKRELHGEGAVLKRGGIPPFRETRNYVAEVGRRMGEARRSAEATRAPAIQLVKEPEFRPLEVYQDPQGRVYLRTN